MTNQQAHDPALLCITVRFRLPVLILTLVAIVGAALIAAWLFHAHSVWAHPLSPTFRGANLHYPAVRQASIAVAAVSVIAAGLAIASRRRRMAVAGAFLLGSAVLVIVGLQSSPAHMWFGGFGSFHPESVLHYSRRFRTAAVTDLVAAVACAVALALCASSGTTGRK
jgi:hypothetical protein